jgi:RHS repeat-associated protein
VENHLNSYNIPYKFNSKELDDETGYYYYGARYYNPRTSLFLSVDKMAEKYPSWSPYAYALQNPIKFIDPDGNEPKSPWGRYYDSFTGKLVYDDGKNDGRVYIRSQINQMGVTKNIDKYIGQENQIPDKTVSFNNLLKTTNAFFTKKDTEFTEKESHIAAGWGGKFLDRLNYFKGQVGYFKDFDIKNKNGSPFKATGSEGKVNYKNNYAFYEGNLLRSDDFGNLNYGVAGKAFGFGDTTLKSAAGWAQLTNPGSPTGGPFTYFDDPKDTFMIGRGINYWNTKFKK